VFASLHQHKWAVLLDSAQQHPDYGRYSYIAIDPFKVLWAKDGHIMVDEQTISRSADPFEYLNQFLLEFPLETIPDLPPFQGGVAGAFSYDLYQYLEDIPLHVSDDMAFPDMAIGLYDLVMAFDHEQEKAWLLSSGLPEKTPAARQRRAGARLQYFLELIHTKPAEERVSSIASMEVSSNVTMPAYTAAVQRVMDYILAGDVFEANLSQCFASQLPPDLDPFSLYKRLRKLTHAPFSAFINLGDIQVVSASPERFIQLDQGKVETRPIKGTRGRSPDPQLDRQWAQDLVNSEKDRAENVMIVDLLRNDLSKICRDHSVQVSQLCALETYASVHHLVSVITGELQVGYNAVDVLKATFPGGSITGAPKIRAMEIIADIEPSRRGIYCGSIGFIGFNGTMDTSIAIRTYTIKGRQLTFQAGGAVVLDSDPDEEYRETLVKARALQQALTEAL